MSRYTEILTRLREATGPDRQLDDDIIKAVWPDAKVLHYPSYTNFQTIPIQRGGPGSFWRKAPSWTESIDAVFALIEEILPGWNWGIYKIAAEVFICDLSPPPTHPNCIMDVVAEGQKCTAPLAALTALLTALEAQEEKP